MKVTDVPAHIVVVDAAIPTDGITRAVTFIVIVFEETVDAVRHVPPVIVMSQETEFPLFSVDVVKVLDIPF